MRSFHRLALFLSLGLVSLSSSATEIVSIENRWIVASFDADVGTLRFAAAGTKKAFAVDGRFSGMGAAAKAGTMKDPRWGSVKAIELRYPDGHVDHVLLAPDVPFALVRTALRNSGTEPTVTQKTRVLTATLDVGQPASKLKVLGTGGLASIGHGAPVGSYMWMAISDPQTGGGVVAGFITTDRGSGVAFASAGESDRVELTAQVDYGRLRLEPGQSETVETFAIGYFDGLMNDPRMNGVMEGARAGLEKYADLVARVYDIHLPPQPVNYCTWYHAHASDEKKLALQTRVAVETLKPFGLQTIQIDDGWQLGDKRNGPKKDFTGFNPKGPYPSGMKETAERIRAAGFTPGLWFMPFAGTFDDPAFKDRQAVFARRADGSAYDTKWGGTCIDMTSPAAREYVRGVVNRMAHEWGYRYFKMDGLYTGTDTTLQYINDAYKDDHIGDAVLADPKKTNIEAYRDGLRLVREAAGKDAFLLGCCANQNMRSYGGAFGLVDAMRIGPDNNSKWEALLRGPRFGSRNYFLNGRVWYNDPDPLYVRPSVPINEARAICSWVTISGQLNTSSDAYADLPAERLDLLKRTMPSHGLRAQPVDLFEQAIPRVWVVTDCRTDHTRRTIVGLFNWEDSPAEIEVSLPKLLLSPELEFTGFEYWSNAVIGPVKGSLRRTIAAHSCEVIVLRNTKNVPQLLGTSRHIMQGMVDVVDEQWDGPRRELSGTSRMVAGDPYELRVVVPEGFKATAVEPADTSTTIKQEGALVRVTLVSKTTGEVKWLVRF